MFSKTSCLAVAFSDFQIVGIEPFACSSQSKGQNGHVLSTTKSTSIRFFSLNVYLSCYQFKSKKHNFNCEIVIKFQKQKKCSITFLKFYKSFLSLFQEILDVNLEFTHYYTQ